MVVMNDRPQAGSAYKPGRIELMIHRIGNSDDDLGANTFMRELDHNNEDAEVRANFWLLFTSDRSHAL